MIPLVDSIMSGLLSYTSLSIALGVSQIRATLFGVLGSGIPKTRILALWIVGSILGSPYVWKLPFKTLFFSPILQGTPGPPRGER